MFGPGDEVPKRAPGHFDFYVFRAQSMPGRKLLLFIHGLSGDAFRTWGSWIRLARAHQTDVDVGTIGYISGTKRLLHSGCSMKDVVALVADELRSLNYESVVIVGHSMGGLVARAALARLHGQFSDGSAVIRRVAGILMMASPGQGSGFAMFARSDLKILKPNSDFIDEVNQFFTNFVDIDLPSQFETRRMYLIPLYSAIATNDRYVGSDSARNRVVSSQQRHFQRRHSSLTKAKDASDAVYQWAMNAVERLMAFPTACAGPRSSPSARPNQFLYSYDDLTLSAQLECRWRQRVRAVEADQSVFFQPTLGDAVHQADLVVRVLNSDLCVRREVREQIAQLHAESRKDSVFSVANLGPTEQTSWSTLRHRLAVSQGAKLYLEAAEDIDELLSHFQHLLWITIDRRRDPLSIRSSNHMGDPRLGWAQSDTSREVPGDLRS